MSLFLRTTGPGVFDLRLEPVAQTDPIPAYMEESLSPGMGFLQTAFWGRFKHEAGWKDRIFRYSVGDRRETLLVLERRLAPGISFAYVPGGPAVDVEESLRTAFLAALASELRPHFPRSCLFIRFDPPWAASEILTDEPQSPESSASDDPQAVNQAMQRTASPGRNRVLERPRFGAPLVKASTDVQPPDTVSLDLRLSEAAILAGMKSKWRYNIRLAAKKGVQVEMLHMVGGRDGIAGAVRRFYELYEITGRRDGIALHERSYYETLARLAAESPETDLRFWFARYDDTDIAAIVTLFMHGEAVYLYGASSDLHRNLMPAYALQWAAIREAKRASCTSYDFYGIPPTDDPSHSMTGLYRFKTGFGGRILHRSGSWDYPLRPVVYMLFRGTEAARSFWFHKVTKLLASLRRANSRPA